MLNQSDDDRGSNLDVEALNAFDDYRLSRFNQKYYTLVLTWWRRTSIGLDIIIASSTALAALKAFSGSHAELIQALSVLSAVAAVLKMSLRIDKNVERYAKIVSRYGETTERYRQLLNEFKAGGTMTPSIRKAAAECSKIIRELSSFDDSQPSRRRLAKLQAEVNEEIPPTFLNRRRPARVSE